MAAIDIYNSKFYTEFTSRNGTVKRIYLILGDDTDISPSASEYPFPPGTFDLAQGLTIEAGFNDDIPLGLMETPSLEFTVNLHYLNFVETLFTGDTLDWRDVRKEIINCQAMSGGVAKTRYKSGVGFECTVQIPNRWYIYDVTNDTMIFDGVQDFNPETTININFSKKQQTTSIVIVHIITQAMKKALPSMYRSLKSWASSALVRSHTGYSQMYLSYRNIEYYASVDQYHTCCVVPIKSVIDALHNLIEAVICIYKRDSMFTLTITNHPFLATTFYSPGYTGTALNPNKYYPIPYSIGQFSLTIIEHTISHLNYNSTQGALVDAEGSVWYDKTMFDFFSELIEGNICKAVINNDGLVYLKILDSHGTPITLTDTDIIRGDVEIVIGGSTYKEFKNNLEGVGDSGIEEFSVQNTQLNNDKSIEVQSLFHNHFCLQEFMHANNNQTAHWSPPAFGLYDSIYSGPGRCEVSDVVDIDVGGGLSTITADSTYNTIRITPCNSSNLAAAFQNLIDFCNARYKVSGIGYIACKALNNVFGQQYNAPIKMTLNSSTANWLNIGAIYTLNLNTMTDSTYLQPPIDTSGFLVRVSQDLIKDETIATFWTRGT